LAAFDGSFDADTNQYRMDNLSLTTSETYQLAVKDGLKNILGAGYGTEQTVAVATSSAPGVEPPEAVNIIGVSHGTATITWAASPSASVAGYKVYVDGAEAQTASRTVSGVTQTIIQNLSGGTRYTVGVTALKQNGGVTEESYPREAEVTTNTALYGDPIGVSGVLLNASHNTAELYNLVSGGVWTSRANQTANNFWISVDFGAKTYLKTITLDSDSSTDFPTALSVYISEDGVNYGAPVCIVPPDVCGRVSTITLPANTGARYFKIVSRFAKSKWWRIRTMRFYAGEDAALRGVYPPSGVSAFNALTDGVSLLIAPSDTPSVTGYKIYSGDNLLADLAANETQYAIGGLAPNTAYEYRVSAYLQDGGEYKESTAVSVTARTALASLQRPANLIADAKDSSGITLKWSRPVTYQNTYIYRNGQRLTSVGRDSVTYKDTRPLAGINKYTVAGVNANGEYSQSSNELIEEFYGNAARNKPVTLISGGVNGAYYPQNAADGSTVLDSRYVSASGNAEAVLELDLQGLYLIDSAKVVTGGSAADADSGFRLQRFNGAEWVDIDGAAVSGNPTENLTMEAAFDGVVVSKVRILTTGRTVSGTAASRIKEIQLFGVAVAERAFTVETFRALDASGGTLTEVGASPGYVNAVCEISNSTEEERKVRVIAAVYDGDSLAAVRVSPETTVVAGKMNQTLSFVWDDFGENTFAVDGTLKLFLWDGLGGAAPLCAPVIVD
jgi:hypothetical protein